jgi:hypothetical protein
VDGVATLNSPINFGFDFLTAGEISDVTNGLWYLYILNAANGNHIRGQVMNYPMRVGGSADVVSYIPAGADGPLAAGSAAFKVVRNHVPTGGSFANGTALVNWNVSGQVETDPAAIKLGRLIEAGTYVIANPITSGGVLAGGSSVESADYLVIGSSGVLADGSSSPSLVTVVSISSAGAVLDGSALWVKIFIPPISGGAFVDGDKILTQIYAAQPTEGGVRAWGEVVAEKLKTLISARHLNYAWAMKTPNKINVNVPQKTKLMSTTNRTTPVLNDCVFKIRHETGWCDFGDQCGTAFLPKIIQKRQGQHLPPKTGDDTVCDGTSTSSVS